MGRFRRYRTAWSRHHRSGGFGIHSPFAFNFVQNVLGERCPYYAYARIAKWRAKAKAALGGCWPHSSSLISLNEARMLFRITNFFNPSQLLVIGARSGVSAASVKTVSCQSALYLYSPHYAQSKVQQQLLQPFGDQVHHYSAISECVQAYFSQISADAEPFVLVNEIGDEMELDALKSAIFPIVRKQGVIVMRNLHKHELAARLWAECKHHAQYGQTYTNGKTGILIANPKLQLEHFSLWLK